jgi:hypothetical protein
MNWHQKVKLPMQPKASPRVAWFEPARPSREAFLSYRQRLQTERKPRKGCPAYADVLTRAEYSVVRRARGCEH